MKVFCLIVVFWVSVAGLAFAEPLPECALATNTQLLCRSADIAADLYFELARADPEVTAPYSQRIVKEAACVLTHEHSGLKVKASRQGSVRIIEPQGSVRVLALHLYHGLSYWLADAALKGTCPRFLNGPGSVIADGRVIADAPPEFYPTDTDQIFCGEKQFEPMVRKAMAHPDTVSDRDFVRAVHEGRCYAATHRYPSDQEH